MKRVRILTYSSYILAFIILVFGIPFYFGYGNPLPFLEESYTLADNIWLIVMPLVFIFAILGIKWKKISGIILILLILIAQIISLWVDEEIVWVMMVPILLGVLYIWDEYLEHKN
ncbi:MAG: hypothetical protein V3569_05780 [Acholeplasmataceae bacterium]|nr:hypothetical protein [Acholeplasmataceae bacterium]